jgi:hypothetical protein
MKASRLKVKRFVQVDDLDPDGNIVTIAEVRQQKMQGRDGSENLKGVLYFKETEIKPLPLNNTNIDSLIALHGDDVEDWIGKQIKLVVREVEAFGKTGPGIRIEEPTQKKKPKK